MSLEPTKYPIIKTGLSRHGHQYGESEKFRSFIAATLKPLVNIQDVLFDLLDIDLDSAQGVKLDLIGRIVGAPAVVPNAIPVPLFGFDDQDGALTFGELDDVRVGGLFREIGQASFTDMILSAEMYRIIIRAQIIKNSSLCTPNDIIKIVNMIIRSGVDFAYVEYPMIIIIAPTEVLTRAEIELLRLMIPRPCGVALAVINGYYDDFGFKDQPYALPFGELDDPSIGGYWSTTHEDLQQLFESGDNEQWL